MAIEPHSFAGIFPLIDSAKLQELADDIKAHGQRDAIVLFEGKILDGRNRMAACKLANVPPKTREFSGTKQEALAYAWSTNVHRRHLNSGQVSVAHAMREKFDAEFAVVVKEMRAAVPKNNNAKKNSPDQKIGPVRKDRSKLVDSKLAASVGTNRSYIADARGLVEKKPELAKKVLAGDLTLSQAKVEARRDDKRTEINAKLKAAPKSDLWKLINSDILSVDVPQARLVFADPPYNIGINYGEHHNDSLPHEEFVGWCFKWMHLCSQSLTDDGSMWVMINDEYAADFVFNLRKCGLYMRGWIKWYETFGVNCSNNFNRTSRHILYFVKNPKKFVFNETEVLRPSDRQLKYNDSRAQSGGKIEDDVWQIPRLSGTCSERIPDFPTQLPLELVSRIISVASEPGDLVIDPFNGSGTTGVASIRLRRKYVGIDASSEFISLASARLENEV
jgi:DNA modification methylase